MSDYIQQVMQSDLGKRAISERWARGLWQFVKKRNREPVESEIYDILYARDAAESAARSISDKNPHYHELLSLWEKYEQHEVELQNRYG